MLQNRPTGLQVGGNGRFDMAEIYTQNGDEITVGLQGSDVCDEAIQAAKDIAIDRGESVRLEDDGEYWDVFPDGTVEEAEPWESDC